MNNEILCVLGVFLVLSACASKEEQARLKQAQIESAKAQQQEREDANGIYLSNTQKYSRMCINKFEENMNDPSSFELAGSWTRRTDYENNAGLYTIMDLGAADIIYSVRIRAKNAMGAKMLGSLKCGFEMNGYNLVLTGTSDRVFSEDME